LFRARQVKPDRVRFNDVSPFIHGGWLISGMQVTVTLLRFNCCIQQQRITPFGIIAVVATTIAALLNSK